MKRLLIVAVLVTAFSQVDAINTQGGIQQLRPGQNGGGVQQLRPGQNGGGVQSQLIGPGGIQRLPGGKVTCPAGYYVSGQGLAARCVRNGLLG